MTVKEEKFCLEYVKCGCGSKAATLAGYSQKTARTIASNLLTKVDIQERIKSLKANIAETIGVSAVMIANELKKLAFTNIADTRTSWITLKDFKKLPEEVKAAIAEIHHETKEVDGKKTAMVKIKMHNKVGAIEALNNMLGFNAPSKMQLSGVDGEPIKQNITCEVVFKDYSKPKTS